ncbi:BTAD domain-containing putative transcriptional regulator [Amycolatopsis rhabdoformis]|uniref:BTAD domain-containing putative transcriptional regulator n=1 Tax=Amycolatopsis rhabdoformis TaxID=1448059 RepID=A0ABZ1I1P5_9PSEU|nr:BTAD domain-containing putative transcriptional regulator [Amycolatopsis rhabdoformis]WSE27722.1 BTAD domain-containing putative transcriptional regulator [Amycolatopsis rhabdoformis]
MRVALLGPLRAACDDGTPVDIGGARLRMLLARLALDAGRPVAAEALIDGLWGTEPPADAANALQSLVSRLRRALRPAEAELESGTGGYRLALPSDAVDAHRFERLATEGRRELSAGREARAAELLRSALDLWHGAALADVLDAPFAAAPATRLEELRTEAAEDRFDAELRLGHHADVLADLTAAAEAHPLRERLAGLRIRALCSAGRQADALAAYGAIRATLAEELGVDPSAELQEIHLQALRGELAPVTTVTDRLPVRLTSFVGRGEELKRLAELLDGARLVTLVGPGGAGKTRLATEAAARHPAHEPGRVWFVPLAGVRDADDVLGALLTALEVRDLRASESEVRRRPTDLLEHAVEALSGSEALLVLDNCEHVIEVAAQLADDLLRHVPALRILATSREPLAITGEALCPLGPLPVPAEATPPSEVGALDSARLFLDRAIAVRPAFTLDESTVDAVTQICRRLDGMPLALELAAARLRSMPVTSIAERLDDRFRLLTSGSRTALPRQRTLRAVVEWSWDLLTDAELTLAQRLAVFAGSFDEDAVTAVCADEDLLPADDVVYVLGSLVEKSIVDTVAGRYRMLETLRVYATERLAASGEAERLRSTMVHYFVDLVERVEPKLRTRDQLAAIALFEHENDNLTAALRSAIESEDVDSAARLLYGNFWYLSILGQGERAKRFVVDVLAFGDRLPPDVAASLRLSQLMMTMMNGPQAMTGAVELIEDCVRTGAAKGNPWLSLALPMVAFLSGHRDLARREITRATEGGDAWSRAAARWAESFLLADEGDLDGSTRAREDAHAGFLEIGDRWGLAMTFSFQATSLSQRGDHDGAIAAHTEGLRLAMELRSQDDVVQQWWRLAVERSRGGDVEGAWRDLTAAERFAEKTGNPELTTILMFGRLELLLREGRLPEAREVGEIIERRRDDWPFPGNFEDEWFGMVHARIALAEGKPDEALPHAASAIRSVSNRMDMPDLARIVEVVAEIRYEQGRFEPAARALGLSALIRGEFDLGSPEVLALIKGLEDELGTERYRDLVAEMRALDRVAGLAWLTGEIEG